MATFCTSLDPHRAAALINQEVVDGSVTGELLDSYTIPGGDGRGVIVLVFEKHYYRAGNRLTLTVTVDNLRGKTMVHTVGGGGGEGLFRFDWGAAESFEDVVEQALRGTIIP